MLRYLTGVAALALMASAVSADPGGGHGKGGGGGGQGGGKDHAAHAGGQGGGNPHAAQGKAEDNRGGGQQQARGNGGGQRKAQGGPARDEHAHADKSRGPDKARGSKDDHGRGNPQIVREARGRDDGRVARVDSPRRDDRDGWRWADATPRGAHGLIAGCPPGLAKKNNGCLPPGQLKQRTRAAFYDSPDWWNFDRRLFGDVDWNDGRYGYYDGYLVRYGDQGVTGWVPLLGGALAPGNVWPSAYPSVPLPSYYQDYYGLGAPDSYRYYDDTLYRVDPGTSAITAIAGLLTGNDFAVGQQMPLGYDIYNVPYSYRDQYIDGPDANYRYSDGYIYQVDPTTQLIQAAISLLT